MSPVYIERIQKIVVQIIMGTRYTSYEDALKYLCLDTLFKRIEMLCLAFALKCLKNPKFKYLFQTTPELEYNLKK